jgi:hypothetical protein
VKTLPAAPYSAWNEVGMECEFRGRLDLKFGPYLCPFMEIVVWYFLANIKKLCALSFRCGHRLSASSRVLSHALLSRQELVLEY